MPLKSVVIRHPFIILLLPLLASLAACRSDTPAQADRPISYEALAAGFQDPPASTRPWVYWYWISDHISREGITRDLEMMDSLGIGAALIGNIFLPEVPRGRVPVLSEEWYGMLGHAIREGRRLGIDIGLFNGPGWVQSGGPWVDSTMAMRHLAWSSRRVKGPALFSDQLEQPASAFQDVAVLAFPLPEKNPMEEANPTIAASHPLAGIPRLIDQDVRTGCGFPADQMKTEPLVIELEFDHPVEARSLLVHPLPEPFSVDIELQVWETDRFRTIRTFSLDRSNPMPAVGPMPFGPVTISFPLVEARRFRLIFSRLNEKAVWFTDVERHGGIAEIELSSSPRLEHFVEKQLGKMHQLPMPLWRDYQWDKPENFRDEQETIDSTQVKDLTGLIGANGRLNWEVPEGDWLILRFGMTPTGVTNAPVSEEGLGLEVDKMNRALVRKHFRAYLDPLLTKLSPEERAAFKYLVVDSYETGSQNWTDDLTPIFSERYGYDPIPWLPVLTGRIVQNSDLSDRFLWDLRRLVADLIGEQYIGGLQEIAAEHGLKLWVENYGHWGFPGEFLQYGSRADLVAGEFWNEGELGNIECRAAASAGHIYGKEPVFAEAYTAAREHYTRYPALLRQRGDWSFTQGINHHVLHVYIQQPYPDSFPGVNAWFGVEFNRHNTWFPYAKPWIDYLRRNHFLLQQGNYQADVCYFIGEGAPLMTGIQEPPLPPGYAFDYINADVILNRLTVENNRLTLPNGISYRLLVLPPLETMSPQLLQKVSDLVRQGAAILGEPPQHSPSLAGYPDADREVAALANELWAGCDGQRVQAVTFGQGTVLRGMNLAEALAWLNATPDLEIPEDAPIAWIHRADAGTDIYFLTNQSERPQEVTVAFRVAGKQPELWDAVSGDRRILSDFRLEGKATSIPLQFRPGQSYYLVFSGPPKNLPRQANFPEVRDLASIRGPWSVLFDPRLGGPPEEVVFDTLTDWSRHSDERIRFYSGPATYRTKFRLDELPEDGRLFLSLGDVRHLARIRLNGREAGGVWTDPWEVEVTGLVQAGENNLEIDVVNTWVNRLIKDSSLPEEDRLTWTAVNPYRPGNGPQEAGLTGRLRLQVTER